MRASARVWLLIPLLLFVPTACGTSSHHSSLACRLRALDRANAAAVIRHYDDGQLGTEPQIKRELRKGDPSFFGSHSQIVPWQQQTTGQQLAFTHWFRGTPRVWRVVGPDVRRISRTLKPNC